MMKKIFLIFMLSIIAFSLFAGSQWFGKDKIMHFSGSAFLTCWSYGISNDIIENSRENSAIFCVGFSMFLGAGKEVSDKYLKKTKWSWHDLAYDLAGICCGLVIINNLR